MSFFVILTLIISSFSKENPLFGKSLLPFFYLDESYIKNVNHGSFGSTPRAVGEKYHKYQEQMDYNPDLFIRFTLPKEINKVRTIVADYINADVDSIVLVENASDGINALFKTLVHHHTKVLIFDIAYGMVKKTLSYLSERLGIQVIQLTITKELINNEDLLLKALEDIIVKEKDITLTSIDHISSAPAYISPVKKIINLMRAYNILTIIDGAHAVGQIPLDLKDLNPDFYVSNFHKWAFAPKSASFLYVRNDLRSLIHPNIISSAFVNNFVSDFNYVGTKDYSAYLAIKDGLEFRKKVWRGSDNGV
jgi:selenocysteine lyase/cysteine desulfurase